MKRVPSFDIITVIGKAYLLVWAERRYLLKLALFPFFVKLICLTLGTVYADEAGLLRLSFFLVAGWLVEGWMLSHFVRLILFKQRWPFRPSGNDALDLMVLESRYRGIMGGAVAFTLIQVALAGWIAMMIALLPVDETGLVAITPDNVAAPDAFLALLMLIASVYGMRFLWLFIPVAGGGDPLNAGRALLPGGMLSLRMIAVWMVCAIPILFIAQFLAAVVISLTTAGADTIPDAAMFATLVLRVVVDLVKNILCAAAFVFAFEAMFGNKKA